MRQPALETRRPAQRPQVLGPLLYGFVWAVLAPGLLLWWAVASEDVVTLPAVHAPAAGAALAGAGTVLMLLGMLALAVHGKGLPMNAYPPPRYVARGIYRWVSHPIYVGFVLLAAGLSVWAGSASGLWLVTPVAALALAALVAGYEGRDLRRRFGSAVRPARLGLPAPGRGRPAWWERASVYLLVLLPWGLFGLALTRLGMAPWSGWTHGAALAVAAATPLFVRRKKTLRRFAVTGLLGLVAAALLYLLWPNAPVAWPVFWGLLSWGAWRRRGRGCSGVGLTCAALLAVGTVLGGAESPGAPAALDGNASTRLAVVIAVGLFLLVDLHAALWRMLLRGAERVANSWREWRIGPVRILNHGFYTGAGGALGALVVMRLAGSGHVLPVVGVALASLLGAALWAQYIEGSPVLLRPLGWYGGLLGGLAGCGLLLLRGVDVLPLLGALALALPLVQATGRLRCLVQGCCHGAPTATAAGIRYRHPRSRVTQIAGLAGVPLHPTPLYSILANLCLAALLFRLWAVGAPVGVVIGLYLILSGLARFVEEAYRGEPQTPTVARLRLYQWLAVGSALLGVPFTLVNVPPPDPAPVTPGMLAAALLVGLVAWFVTGVDFPGSNRRFSRLAAADDRPQG
ncbi:MAG: prolipoprotein diacylglyceryl transferase family protein [Symbiobacterium sp.]|uniref:prolipoprotein diacylglyceryl transferase family protein n=1 Tax=Symbiobacterium sp. TaxID=1971213 RepID=UPI00346474D4